MQTGRMGNQIDFHIESNTIASTSCTCYGISINLWDLSHCWNLFSLSAKQWSCVSLIESHVRQFHNQKRITPWRSDISKYVNTAHCVGYLYWNRRNKCSRDRQMRDANVFCNQHVFYVLAFPAGSPIFAKQRRVSMSPDYKQTSTWKL